MALTARLELRQGQQLVMTPQLQQAIRLLQLSNVELTQFVETELERNPLLEREDNAEEPAAREADEPTSHDGDSDHDGGEASAPDEWLDLERTVVNAAETLDTDHDNVFPDTARADMPDANAAGWAATTMRSGSFDGEESNLEDFATSDITLRQHLANQLPLALTSPADRLIGNYLIDMVDEAGYVRVDLHELATKLGAPVEMVERILATLQTFDPPGVFARNLSECLALQLKDQNRFDPQIAVFLANLHLLAQHNLAGLRKAVGCDADDLTDMISEIKRLNPKPGLKFGSTPMQPVVPDILLRTASDGSWHIELNSETLPRVLVNRQYYTRVSKSARNDKDKDYLLECFQTANWLVKSLDQRARTILRVAEEIVRQQDAFFTHGVQYLRPMNLKTVAEAISMHESTVSRVTSNKYVSTPRGILELKYFFTSSIASASDDGEAHSSESVRHRIRQMIDAEGASAILSDDMIVDKLKRDGVDIARRTVAKYREAMRIPSSVQRRREKRTLERLERIA
jgi:RNA polymerase sigma-54 factor